MPPIASRDAVLLLTHSGDFYTIDLVSQALARRGVRPIRFNTDLFPSAIKLSAVAGDERTAQLFTEAGEHISTAEVRAVWARKIWSPRMADDLDERFRSMCVAESIAALEGFLDALHDARWVNDLQRQRAAENKQRQLRLAARAGLRVPRTLVTNDPVAAREFFAETKGQTVAKLLRPIAVSMDADTPFVYTNRVREEDLEGAESLRHSPMVFQELIPKACELRVAYVAGETFAGALEASGTSRGQTDWRRVAPEECSWQTAQLPTEVTSGLQALMSDIGLVFGAVDLICTPSGEYVFLEVNPGGEWGMLERDLGLPISEAIAEALLEEKSSHKKAQKMSILIVTHSNDNDSVARVIETIARKGGHAIRFDTDRYPTDVRLTAYYGASGSAGDERLTLTNDEGEFDLREVTAIWHRRINFGANLPAELDRQLRRASLGEASAAAHGMLASLKAFRMDHLRHIRHAENKQLQLQVARELGLNTPRTLTTNDPAAVRAFAKSCDGEMVTKMLSSFAIYDEGKELVVFTNPVTPEDLADLSGLSLCPATFQELIPKSLEIRVTVVGHRVMSAAVDSQVSARAAHDWRRDGVRMLQDWRSYQLPHEVEEKILRLMDYFSLNYGAIDVILTPDGRHVFLELNPCGEFFWLERTPGLLISEAIADVLLEHA